MAALESMNAVEYVRQLVEVEKKTHNEISIILKQVYPEVVGLSERTVRRFCARNNIHSRNRNLSREDLDAVVSSAVAEVSKLISIFPKFRSNPFPVVNSTVENNRFSFLSMLAKTC